MHLEMAMHWKDILTECIEDSGDGDRVEWEEPVPHSPVHSEHILPQIKRIVSVVSQQVGVSIPEVGGRNITTAEYSV